MSRQALADRHMQAREMFALQTSAQLTQLWREVDTDDVIRSWQAQVPHATAAVTRMQTRAVQDAQQYVTASIIDAGREPRGPALNPRGFAGFTYPLGKRLEPMPLQVALASPAYQALNLVGQGISPQRALAGGLEMLITHGVTAVSDAGRQADGALIATEPQITGYVRQVESTACSRCIILAGRRYARSDGFLRHPNCLCEHTPIFDQRGQDSRDGADQEEPDGIDPYTVFNGLSEEEQDRRFTAAGAQAIRDGADINQVVNSRRGMYTTAQGQRFTTEGIGRSRGGRRLGHAGRAMDNAGFRGARLLPEQIYENARRYGGGRERILEDLRGYGYITGAQIADGSLSPILSGNYGPAMGYRRRAMNYEQALENERLGRYSWNPNR